MLEQTVPAASMAENVDDRADRLPPHSELAVEQQPSSDINAGANHEEAAVVGAVHNVAQDLAASSEPCAEEQLVRDAAVVRAADPATIAAAQASGSEPREQPVEHDVDASAQASGNLGQQPTVGDAPDAAREANGDVAEGHAAVAGLHVAGDEPATPEQPIDGMAKVLAASADLIAALQADVAVAGNQPTGAVGSGSEVSCRATANDATASPISPLLPPAACAQAATVGSAVRLMLDGDSADLLIPLAEAVALGFGGRLGRFEVRLQLPAGSRAVTLSWIERPNGSRFLQAIGAQRRVRRDLGLSKGPQEVAFAPELGGESDLRVSLPDKAMPEGSAVAAAASYACIAVGTADGAAPMASDAAAAETVSGVPQLSEQKRKRADLREASGSRLLPCAGASALACPDAICETTPDDAGCSVLPAQRIFRITAPANKRVIPILKARAAGLRWDYSNCTADVPELQRKVTVGAGWRDGSFRLDRGWPDLAKAMGMREAGAFVLTVVNGSISSIGRATTAAASGSTVPGANANTSCAAGSTPSLAAALVPQRPGSTRARSDKSTPQGRQHPTIALS